MSRFAKVSVTLIVVGMAIGVPLWFVPDGVRWWQARREQKEKREREPEVTSAIQVSRTTDVGVTVSLDRWQQVGLSIEQVIANTVRRTLKMEGVLYLDPDDYAPIRSRFSGEIVEVPQITADVPYVVAPGDSKHRSLRFGDQVKKGDLLAVVWSRDLGEKKSEFAETLARLDFNRESLVRLTQVRDSIPVNTLRDAERRVREEELAAERIEKTLLTWQLSPEEIQRLRSELAELQRSDNTSKAGGTAKAENSDTVDNAVTKHAGVDRWARVELRSPIDGTIVEKNITVGALVSPEDTLFKIANLTHLDVRAFAYEEDLAALQRLAKEDRKWTINLQSDTKSKPIDGYFDRISSLIDPVQHTGLVMGWVGNADLRLRPGQFVTASIAFPDSEAMLSVPATAVVDVDSKTYVLLQDPKNAEHFVPTRVNVVRFQNGMATLSHQQESGDTPAITTGSFVVSTGAVEIIAECREHLREIENGTATNATDSSTTPDARQEIVMRDVAELSTP